MHAEVASFRLLNFDVFKYLKGDRSTRLSIFGRTTSSIDDTCRTEQVYCPISEVVLNGVNVV